VVPAPPLYSAGLEIDDDGDGASAGRATGGPVFVVDAAGRWQLFGPSRPAVGDAPVACARWACASSLPGGGALQGGGRTRASPHRVLWAGDRRAGRVRADHCDSAGGGGRARTKPAAPAGSPASALNSASWHGACRWIGARPRSSLGPSLSIRSRQAWPQPGRGSSGKNPLRKCPPSRTEPTAYTA
jgi:hypothetical protein